MAHSAALSELIIVLGKTGVGKSTFIRAATGLDVKVGESIMSCNFQNLTNVDIEFYNLLRLLKGTAEVQIYPIPNSRTFLIDTPGFDDPVQTDTKVLQSIASCLADLYEGLTFPNLEITLSGVVYLQSINEPRMSGSMKKNLRMLASLVGKYNMQHCVLVSSKWKLEELDSAQRKESELIHNADYWGSLREAGAQIARYKDSRHSALEIIQVSKRAGFFVPQLTQEYVIEGKELYETAAGQTIDEDTAKILRGHENDLIRLREEHRQALEDSDAKSRAELEALILQKESKLKTIADETGQLHATRNAVQTQLDRLESSNLHSDYGDNRSHIQADHNKRRARQKRALRWFGRAAAMGAAVSMSVLSGGTLAPVGISLYGTVETICQMDKDRERAKK